MTALPAPPTTPPADDEPPEPCLDCERVTCACGDVGDLETRLDRALGARGRPARQTDRVVSESPGPAPDPTA